VTRTIEPPIAAESATSQDADVEEDKPSVPVIHQAPGSTRIVISQRSRASAGPRPSTYESTDYGYVVKDLRRVTIVAGALTLVLIVLSLVIR
jgi:hypothetical protein